MTIEHQIPNLGVTGSNPVGVANVFNWLSSRRVPRKSGGGTRAELWWGDLISHEAHP